MIPALIGIYQIYNIKTNRQETLDLFYKEQQEKKTSLEQSYANILKELAEKVAKKDQEVQKIAEKVDKNFNPNLPDCPKLKNRTHIRHRKVII